MSHFVSAFHNVNYNFCRLSRIWLRNTFGVLEEYIFADIVVVKKLHSNFPQNVTNIFTKEALLLRQRSSKNLAKVFGVCKNPLVL